MSNLTLNRSFSYNVTLVPNDFLDRFMPHANGEFVKVYLQLLRLSAAGQSYTLSDVADMLSCTEKDIVRALRYWEKEGLLHLSKDAGGEISGVTFADTASGAGTVSNLTGSNAASDSSAGDPPAADKETTSNSSEDVKTTQDNIPSDNIPRRRQLSASRITQLENKKDFSLLLFVSAQYLGRILTRTDIDTLGYFYDELHMPADLIEYLIEYCVSNNHKSIRYIETVGLAWHSEGIKTVNEAKEASRIYQQKYFGVFKALGINNHTPISTEIQTIDKWTKVYQFSMDMIQEACTRTIMQTAKPSIHYADRILTRWYKNNVHTLEDVKKEDEIHQQNQSRVKDQKSSSRGKDRKPSGSFYNFEQRTYDSDLEGKLLGIPSDNK